MTTGAFDEDREPCLAAGMDDFIAKPVDFDQLADTVARWTHGHDERDTGGQATVRGF